MATVTTTPNQVSASSAMAYTSEIETRWRVSYEKVNKDKEGNETTEVKTDLLTKEEDYQEIEKTGKYDGHTVLAVDSQSFLKYKANTKAGMDELIPDEKESVAMWNRGTSTKQDNKIRQIMMQTQEDENGNQTWVWTPTAEPYDLRESLKVETKVRMSEFEKFAASAKTMQFTPDQIEFFKNLFAQREAQSSGTGALTE